MYEWDLSDKLKKKLKKLFKKDKLLHQKIMKKIKQIVNSFDVESYKNLRHDLSEYKRVHIGHFILVFRFDKTNNLIIFDDFDHHDKIYR